MRYMSLIKGLEGRNPPPALYEAISQLVRDANKAGVLVMTGGLAPTKDGIRVRQSDGRLNTTDGPFTEAKEVVGGYAIYDVSSRQEMMEWTTRFMELHRRHWPEWDGECEVREMMEADLSKF